MNFKKVVAMLMPLVLLLFSSLASAEKNQHIAGNYTILPGKDFKFDGKTVEIIEFLSFSCGTCYNFERQVPIIKGNFPNKINWKIVPIYWGRHGSSRSGEAYLLAEEAGKGEEMKRALFNAKMVEKLDIGDFDVLENLAVKIGMGFDFSRKLRSGAKARESRQGIRMAGQYGVNGTPTLVIAGNIVTSPHSMNHDLDEFRTNVIAILKSIFK